MISKIAPQNIYQKNIHILEAWKPAEDMKFRLEFFLHMLFYIWTQYNIKIVLGTWQEHLQTAISLYFTGWNSSRLDIRKNKI